MDNREYEFSATGLSNCRHSLIVTRWNTQEKYRIAELVMCRKCARLFEWQDLVDRDSSGKQLWSKKENVPRGTNE